MTTRRRGIPRVRSRAPEQLERLGLPAAEEGSAGHAGEKSSACEAGGGRDAAGHQEQPYGASEALGAPDPRDTGDRLAEQELIEAIAVDDLARSIWEKLGEDTTHPAADAEPPLRPVSKALGAPDAGEVGDRLAEQELIDAIRSEGLGGPSWRVLQRHLAEYGLAVLVPWIMSAMIFVRCREQGLSLPPWRVAPTREQAGDLASGTIVRALRSFARRALGDNGWSSSGGASLETWFIGCCLFEFANEWRSWVAAQNRADDGAAIAVRECTRDDPGPESQVIGEEAARELLASIDSTTGRQVVLLKQYGYTHKEIAALLGLPSERAVEGVLYRIRMNLRRRQKEERARTLYPRRSSGGPVEVVETGSEGGRLS